MASERSTHFGLLFACCLLAAASGCSLHRTGNGIVLRSDWSLEYRRAPLLAFRSGNCADCDENSCEKQALAADGTHDASPEMLPWRSRLKGYRLGARLFRGEKFAGEQHPYETDGPPSGEAAYGALSSRMAFAPPDAPPDYDVSVTATAAVAELQLPDSIGRLPEPNRPDLVVD